MPKNKHLSQFKNVISNCKTNLRREHDRLKSMVPISEEAREQQKWGDYAADKRMADFQRKFQEEMLPNLERVIDSIDGYYDI